MGRGKARGGVVNRRGRGKARVVSPVMDQGGCSGRDPDCPTPAETGVGISARIYDSNGDKARQGPGSERRQAGTGGPKGFSVIHPPPELNGEERGT